MNNNKKFDATFNDVLAFTNLGNNSRIILHMEYPRAL